MNRLLLLVTLVALRALPAAGESVDTITGAKPGDRVQAVSHWYKKYGGGQSYSLVRSRYDSIRTAAGSGQDRTYGIAALCFLAEYYRSAAVMDYERAGYCYERALAGAEREKLRKSIPLLMHELGNVYYKQEKYTLGLEYLLRANIRMQQIGFDEYPGNGIYLYDLGYAYAYNFEDFQNAREYLDAAVRSTFPDPYSEIQCYNMLGLVYRATGNYDSALYFFNTALAKARAAGDTASMGDITGNIGYHYFMQGQFDKARPLFEQDYRIGIRKKNWVTASLALLILTDMDVQEHRLSAADEKIGQVQALIDSARIKYPNKAVLTAGFSLYTTLVRIARLRRDDAATARYLDSLMAYKDGLYATRDNKMQSAVQIKLLKENNKYELELLKSEERRKIQLRNALLLISFLAIIIIIQISYRLKVKNKKDAEQLSLYADSLFEKNQLLEQFKSEMQQLKEQPDRIEDQIENTLNKLRNATILTDQQWQEFKMLFEKIYKNFFANIIEKIPDLTQAEMRLLALTKLGLSTKQMAEMLGISAESIRKARYRLRKKIELRVKKDSEHFFMLKHV